MNKLVKNVLKIKTEFWMISLVNALVIKVIKKIPIPKYVKNVSNIIRNVIPVALVKLNLI